MLIKFPNTIAFTNKKVELNLDKPSDNIVNIDYDDYIPYYLNNNDPGNKGGNSHILKLVKAQEISDDDPYPEEPDLVIKICRDYISLTAESKRSKRFNREIETINKCKNLQNIINIIHFGEIEGKFKHRGNTFRKQFQFYTMPYAECDLTQYLENNDLELLDRVILCIELCISIGQLDEMGYYHRDIKPDNILFINNEWVISDLGLVKHREDDLSFDLKDKWIGPRGWMSPESMNRYLSHSKRWEKIFDCEIDHQSDIYQLGKVLWYIMQGNSPEGGIRRNDFLWANDDIYQIIKTMINHSKYRRYDSISQAVALFKKSHEKILKYSSSYCGCRRFN